MTGLGQLRARPLVGGLASFIPPLFDLLRRSGGGGSHDPAYCHDVWTRHWAALRAAGMTEVPETVLELGPGRSIGVGLAALLSGAERAWALDVETHADIDGNLAVLEALAARLYESRGAPQEGGEPPLTAADAARLTDPARRAAIAEAIRALPRAGTSARLRYIAPWSDPDVLPPGSVGLMVSQAVLEHVMEPAALYDAAARWLKPGGWMRHVIDLRSHGTTKAWNGHWALRDPLWRLLVGRRSHLINRLTASDHLALIEAAGLEVVAAKRREEDPADGIGRDALAPRFRAMAEADLHCSGLKVIARKPAG